MTAVLLVRLSSLGDIIHTFPAVTDLRRHVPRVCIDWVVEEAYVDLVRLHPMIDGVIPIAMRRWRRAPLASATWREVAAARRKLGRVSYDAIIETQGLVKSALVAKLAHGPLHGFGPGTARERFASRFYRHRYEFAASDHKIYRYRALAARTLGYALPAVIDYGLAPPPPPSFTPSRAFCVLAHATARAGKLWQESSWIALAQALAKRGLVCVLPWGNDDEKARAARIVAAVPGALLAPRMSIGEAAGLLARAAVVVGLDTGLTHLAAALKVPVVGVFCDSEPADAHPIGMGPATYRGGVGRPPSVDEVLDAVAEVAPELC
jgi:heptosyltransferase-1